MPFQRINPSQLKQLQREKTVTVLDIRDPASYAQGHIDDALSIEQVDVESFVEEQPREQALVICCYHGISSQSAAAWFADKGFAEVYSLDGGYESWKGSA